MTREERAFNRLHRPSKSKPATQKVEWPRRILEVTGPSLNSPAHCVWEQKYGVWFMMKADHRLQGWMADKTGVLCEPSLERICRLQNLTFRWLS